MADSFNALKSKALSTSLIKGFYVGRDELCISHLQYANDIMSFIGDSEEQVENLKHILMVFKIISEFCVNFLKSSLVDIDVGKEDLNRYALILGCKVDTWPMKYLGLPLGGHPKSLPFWDPVVERF